LNSNITMNFKKGSILILTLWTLSFLTIFAIGVGSNVSSQLHLASHLQDRLKMYCLAKAGIEKAIIGLAADENPDYDSFNEKQASAEALFKEIALGDGYVTVSYQLKEKTLYGPRDESSRININKAPLQILKSMLENIGEVETEEAADIAHAIVDWRDIDVLLSPGGAENEHYQSLELPYPCKNADFQIPEELLLVKGMTPEIYSKIADVITIYGTGGVNINTADGRALQALGLSADLVERIVEFRRGSDGAEGTEDDNIFETVGEIRSISPLFAKESEEINRLTSLNALTVKSDVFRISSAGILRVGSRTLQRNITCIVQRAEGKDPRILYWHEE